MSANLKRLAREGMIRYEPYGAIELTDQGERIALEVVRRHRLIETFLVEHLGYHWDQVHDEAETLEHAVSDFMIDRIDEHLGYPERDPHGDPIPRADGTVDQPDAIVLTDLTPGVRARVERISDEDPGLLQYFAEHGVGYGTIIETQPGAPFSDAVGLAIEDTHGSLSLGRAATDAVWVTLL